MFITERVGNGMSRRNIQTTPAERALNEARREHGRRSPKAIADAAEYGQDMAERITTQAEQGAARTQRGWDRNGTPMWMRVKTVLGLAGRRG